MVDASAVARVVGIETEYKDFRGGRVLFLPQRIAVFAQGETGVTYSSDKWQATSAGAAGARYGYKSPIYHIAREFLPVNGDGVGTIPVTVYPLSDHASGVASAGDITPSGTATAAGSYRVRIGGVLSEPFNIAAGAITVGDVIDDMVAAINAVLHMPGTAVNNADTSLDFTVAWQGVSGDGVKIEIIGPSLGVAFAITQPTGGLNNPDVDPALLKMGNVWETMAINQMEIADTTTLDKFSTFGEGRWGELVRKPLIVFTGNTEADVGDATTVSAARRTDRVNAQLVAPGSPSMPFVVAARQLARIAKVANNNPPTGYAMQRAASIIPGTDAEQWDYAARDQAVKAGSSTVEVIDGVVNISDVVTFYRPTGEEPPAYRHVDVIVRLQNIIFNTDLIFAAKEWASAPLIPDDQPTTNPNARKPKSAKTAIMNMLDDLALQAIISDPGTAKSSILAQISSSNPRRLDIEFEPQVSGNTDIISAKIKFGFFFGTAAVVG